MRILFVSGTSIGGSAHSTRELAERLVARGHDVSILFRVEGAKRTRYVHKRAINLVVKLGSTPPRVASGSALRARSALRSAAPSPTREHGAPNPRFAGYPGMVTGTLE
jgi:UDP:flavonoid glycosyltransferase YjiC (YdhE family)